MQCFIDIKGGLWHNIDEEIAKSAIGNRPCHQDSFSNNKQGGTDHE